MGRRQARLSGSVENRDVFVKRTGMYLQRLPESLACLLLAPVSGIHICCLLLKAGKPRLI
jgi:hypothetical protein